MPSMFALLSQRHLYWLDHVSHMQGGWIPKGMLYSELATGSRPVGRPVAHSEDVCKRDMKAGNIDPAGWEAATSSCSRWRFVIKETIKTGEQKREDQWEEKRVQTAASALGSASTELNAEVTCSKCNRACHSCIGLYSCS